MIESIAERHEHTCSLPQLDGCIFQPAFDYFNKTDAVEVSDRKRKFIKFKFHYSDGSMICLSANGDYWAF